MIIENLPIPSKHLKIACQLIDGGDAERFFWSILLVHQTSNIRYVKFVIPSCGYRNSIGVRGLRQSRPDILRYLIPDFMAIAMIHVVQSSEGERAQISNSRFW